MRKFRTIILLLVLLVLPVFLKAQGVNYFQGDVYDALLTAKYQGKALIVECYAGWNNKSRWMNEMINSNEKVLEFLSKNFIVWQIDTRTKEGAKFAVDYKVNDYPSLFVFNQSGSVVDKIDRAMEADDFITNLEEDLFTLNGGNLWKLEQLEKAAQSGDREKADEVFYDYLDKVGQEHILNKSHRWVFDDRTITFYGSTSFFFMVNHRQELSETPQDSVEIDGFIYSAIYDKMKEMLLDHNSSDTIILNDVTNLAKEVLPLNQILPLFPPTIKAYASSDFDSYLHLLDNLIEAAVMSWRGTAGGIKAAKAGNNVVMAPQTYFYIDYYQSDDTDNEPYAIGGFLPLEKVYEYEPFDSQLTPEQCSYILGVQANLWCEYVHSPDHAWYMTFPRALACAEIGWSMDTTKNFAAFYKRMSDVLSAMDRDQIPFRIPEPLGLFSPKTEDGVTSVELTSPVRGSEIYYTIDGSDPQYNGAIVTTPLSFPSDSVFKCVVKLPSGRFSAPYRSRAR